jgi:hypothetical protein
MTSIQRKMFGGCNIISDTHRASYDTKCFEVQYKVYPPSTTSSVPVINLLASLAMNTMAPICQLVIRKELPLRSSGCPSLFIGDPSFQYRVYSSPPFAMMACTSGVFIYLQLAHFNYTGLPWRKTIDCDSVRCQFHCHATS